MQTKSVFLLLLFFLPVPALIAGGVQPYDLRLEHLTNPAGIDELKPRFSWKLKSNENGQSQSAYQITVRKRNKTMESNGLTYTVIPSDDGRTLTETVWETGKVQSSSQFIEYGGQPLESKSVYGWTLTVFDKQGYASEQAAGTFETGILTPDGWKAKWIGQDIEEPELPLPMDEAVWIWTAEEAGKMPNPGDSTFRKTFDIPATLKITAASFAFAADNEFTAYLNGIEIGHGNVWSSAEVIDATKAVKTGRNVLVLKVSNHGDSPNPAGLLGVLGIQLERGNALLFQTDKTWKSSTGWDKKYAETVFDDTAWKNAVKIAGNGQAPWGKVATATEHPSLPAAYLRKYWTPKGKIAAATAYVAGLGYYEFELNGKKIGDHLLDPVLTDYDKRVSYVAYPLDPHIIETKNVIGVILGSGRYYAPRTTPTPTFWTRTFGKPKLLFQLEVLYQDGSAETVISDESWQFTTDGPIRENNDYDGEIYDARKNLADASIWKNAEIVAAPKGKLVAQMMPPMRVLEELTPVSVTEIKPGVWIFDFGINTVGSPRFKPLTGRTAETQLPAGTEFTLRFAETLIPDGPDKGHLYTANLRTALCRDIYIASGKETAAAEYAPKFTYHGYRYAELTVKSPDAGFSYTPDKTTLTARWINTALPVIGQFKTDNETINAVFRIVFNGTRGNYLSIPTDCPQRDERHGWQGDRAGEALGEMMMFDGITLYSKWLKDIEDSQREDGGLSNVCPNYWSIYDANVTWPSTFTVIPDTIYTLYGDRRPIERHYEAMKRWLIGHLGPFVKDGIISEDRYGDWCVPPEKPELIHSKDPARRTPKDVLATSYYIYNLDLLTKYAKMLGKEADAAEFSQKAAAMRTAFNAKFLNCETGQYGNGTQTSCILPLYFNIVPEEMKAKTFAALVNNIENVTKNHVGTGLIGGQWLHRVLTDFGRADIAYTFSTNRDYPGWGYMIEKGATTVWELWNGDTADPAMNSGNHVMLVGDLTAWYYESLAGIKADPQKPGFEHIMMKPLPVSGLNFVEAEINTVRGLVRSGWKKSGKAFRWNIEIPAGSTATVYLPDGKVIGNVVSGKHSFECTLPLQKEG